MVKFILDFIIAVLLVILVIVYLLYLARKGSEEQYSPYKDINNYRP